jgi:AcrB/AcrD/AcrF family
MVPPYFASGAGAEMRRSLGTAVLWGAFGVTLFGIFLTPVFYSVVRWFSGPGAVRHALTHAHGSSVVANGVPDGSQSMVSR